MYAFCPHCGQTIEQEQTDGCMLVCIHCGEPIGMVGEALAETAEPRVSGNAARCGQCGQLVEIASATKTFVPHYRSEETRKICPGSGKKADG